MIGLKPSNKEPAKQYETVAVRKDQYEALCANYAAALAEIKRLNSVAAEKSTIGKEVERIFLNGLNREFLNERVWLTGDGK